MDLTPPALTRSPSSPSNTYCPSERSSVDYPSPGYHSPNLVAQQYKIASIYGAGPACSMAPSIDTETSSLPPLDAMSQADWGSPTTVMHPHHHHHHHHAAAAVSSSSSMPNVLAAEYDAAAAAAAAFGGYELPPPYGHDVYQQHSVHSHPASPHAPAGPRSPVHHQHPHAHQHQHQHQHPSSARSSIAYPGPTNGALAPRPPKLDTTGEYGQGIEVSQYPSPRSIHGPYTTEAVAATGFPAVAAASGYLSDGQSPASWHSRPEYQPVESSQYFGGANGQADGFLHQQHDGRRSFRVARPRRAQRRLTTKEEANFQCEVKGCGKLFSRSYNFKAHMETHDEKREYPFPCPVADCDKKFVRKTDLQRHHQSVHMKERSHKCDYCGRMFARKDTLRRHMEDGCSKRFDIGTLDVRAESYEALHPIARHPLAGHMGQMVSPPGSLPPMAIPPLGSSGLLEYPRR